MQDKKARKAARQVNLFLDPSLKEEGDYVKKNGNRLPKRARDFSHVASHLDREIIKKGEHIPPNISPLHYLAIKKVFEIAYRENVTEKEVECPSCDYKFNVDFPNVKAEANSIAALNALFDRMYPKLGHLTQDINITGYMNTITEYIVKIVVAYVPANKKPEAMAKISEMFERLISNENGNGIGSPATNDEANRLLESIA